MVTFAWQLLPGLYAPVPIAALVLEFPGQPAALVGGIWDTGASVTTLQTSVDQPRLNVPDDQCVPMAFGVASGAKIMNKLTVVNASLDGHQFRLPIAFADAVPLKLIGRVGIADQWEVRSDPLTYQTTFEWRGVPNLPGSQPWAVVWETYWTALLNLRYDWPNWNANGRPDLPPTPNLPPELPPAAP